MYMEWPNRIWVASLDLILFLDLKKNCEHVPRNKLRRSTNFIIFGPTHQKLWGNKKFRRSMGRAGMYWSQPARVDHISPKRWAARIRRFEKSLLRVSSLVF
jgi:hypothetical protein